MPRVGQFNPHGENSSLIPKVLIHSTCTKGSKKTFSINSEFSPPAPTIQMGDYLGIAYTLLLISLEEGWARKVANKLSSFFKSLRFDCRFSADKITVYGQYWCLSATICAAEKSSLLLLPVFPISYSEAWKWSFCQQDNWMAAPGCDPLSSSSKYAATPFTSLYK